MSWLVLDTAMPSATVALVDGADVRAVHVLKETKRHAESLVDAVDRVLLQAGVTVDALEGVAVGRGPGSFIGVRTGIAFAKGLALGRGIPVVGLGTLEAVVRSEPLPDGEAVVVIDAKRGEAFVQRFLVRAGACTALDEPRALAVESAHALCATARVVVGNVMPPDGASATHVRLDGPTARGLALTLAARAQPLVDETDALVPDYRRDADAKLPATDPSARRDLLGA